MRAFRSHLVFLTFPGRILLHFWLSLWTLTGSEFPSCACSVCSGRTCVSDFCPPHCAISLTEEMLGMLPELYGLFSGLLLCIFCGYVSFTGIDVPILYVWLGVPALIIVITGVVENKLMANRGRFLVALCVGYLLALLVYRFDMAVRDDVTLRIGNAVKSCATNSRMSVEFSPDNHGITKVRGSSSIVMFENNNFNCRAKYRTYSSTYAFNSIHECLAPQLKHGVKSTNYYDANEKATCQVRMTASPPSFCSIDCETPRSSVWLLYRLGMAEKISFLMWPLRKIKNIAWLEATLCQLPATAKVTTDLSPLIAKALLNPGVGTIGAVLYGVTTHGLNLGNKFSVLGASTWTDSWSALSSSIIAAVLFLILAYVFSPVTCVVLTSLVCMSAAIRVTTNASDDWNTRMMLDSISFANTLWFVWETSDLYKSGSRDILTPLVCAGIVGIFNVFPLVTVGGTVFIVYIYISVFGTERIRMSPTVSFPPLTPVHVCALRSHLCF